MPISRSFIQVFSDVGAAVGKNANIPKPANSLGLNIPPKMSSPAPLLRPPIPGSRQNSGTRTPRLGLAIPPSPSVKPVNGGSQPGSLPVELPKQSSQLS